MSFQFSDPGSTIWIWSMCVFPGAKGGGLHHRLVFKPFGVLCQVSFTHECLRVILELETQIYKIPFLSSLPSKISTTFSGSLGSFSWPSCQECLDFGLPMLSDVSHNWISLQGTSGSSAVDAAQLPTESAALLREPCKASGGKEKQDISPIFCILQGYLFSFLLVEREIFSWLCPQQCSRIWVALRLNQGMTEGKN